MTDNDTSDREFGEETEVESDDVLESDKEELEDNQEEETKEPEETKEVEPEEKSEDAEETKSETKLTEKGTKLDPNPQSAVHQQLANEKAKSQQYEKVLRNPQLLSQYMKTQFKGTPEKEQPKTEAKEYKADDFEKLSDVANVVNTLQKNFADKTKSSEEKITELKNTISTIVGQGQRQQVASNIERDIGTISKLPEFDSKSPDYVKGLQEQITKRFKELDFDENTKLFRGQHSIAQIAKDAISNINLGKKAGSLKTQTIVKNKSAGKVKVSPKVDEDTGDKELSPGESIAKGIKKLRLR